MPGTNVDITTKTTVVFGTSGFSADILSIGFPGISRDSVETTHFGTSAPGAGSFAARTHIPVTLSEAGEFTMDVHFNPITDPPIDGAAETVTVTWPLVSGDLTSTIWVFTGFITSYEMTGPLEDKMTASLTVKISGSIAITDAT